MKTRPKDMPKIVPGTRVRYEYGRWEIHGHKAEMEYDEQLAARPHASEPQVGTVVPDEEFGPYPSTHAWGVPPYASAVRFDDQPQHVTWVRSACLECIGFAQADSQQGELFATIS